MCVCVCRVCVLVRVCVCVLGVLLIGVLPGHVWSQFGAVNKVRQEMRSNIHEALLNLS